MKTNDRVRKNTLSRQNQSLDNEAVEDVRFYSAQEKRIGEERVKDLDKEWGIERVLELNAGLVALAGTALAFSMKSRYYFLIPAVVTAFLVEHALQGWCPPLPLFRKLGFRTGKEIAREKYTLKTLLGHLRDVKSPEEAWRKTR